ncbi:MAG TPA: transglycosylase domain-containing protein [Pseudoneobacillus sp.]|nr:transglycosylase domain-containing protein [Pseudoneobacillus sp.]
MRQFTGYFIVIILFPLLILLLKLTTVEANESQSFHSFLNHHIQLNKSLEQNSYIVDRNNKVVDEWIGSENRNFKPLSDIPIFTKNIFLQSEDKRFYEHKGFDIQAISRALSMNIKDRDISEGASTITQQTARNLYLSHEKSYNRKLSELLYAYQMERKLTKDEILELYLNVIYFQHGVYGIESAARFYFYKTVGELSPGEQAFLAAIPNNPTLYDPLQHFDLTKKRQERLVDQLVDADLLSVTEASVIKKEEIRLQVRKNIHTYPDYTNYVRTELTNLIANNEGINEQLAHATESEKENIENKLKDKVYQVLASGVIVHTALDPTIQLKAKKAINKHLPYEGIEGAVSVIDNSQLSIIALIGGKHYQNNDFNRSYQAFRQPGSSIKPLLDYAPYLNQPNTATTDLISGAAFCKHGYCPENYGGAKYGLVSIVRAFIHSYNTPAVRLLDRIGIQKGFSYLEKFHFQRMTKQDYRLAAAIGGFTYGMSPLELAGAYTTFANEGKFKQPHAILKVTDLEGNLLYQWKDQSIKIYEQDTVKEMRDLLRKTITSGTARKAIVNSSYAGGKTGTTNEYKDYWFVGLTDQLTAAVWVGKDTPESIEGIEKASPHLLIWRDIMKK